MNDRQKYRYQMLLQHDTNYQWNLYMHCKQILNETCHIVTDFLSLTKWLSTNLKTFDTDKLIYTGWNYHIISNQCNQDNNKNTGYPIYVIIDSHIGNEKTFAYVEDRDLKDNKIILHVNVLHINDTDILSKLRHEFTHIKTQYSNFYKDPLVQKKIKYNIKDLIHYINREKKEYSFNYITGSIAYPLFRNHYKKACACLYYMSETEQEARINQVYHYIVQKYNDDDELNHDLLLSETHEITLLKDFDNLFELYERDIDGSAKDVLCLAYYLNQLGCIHYDILNDKDLMLKYFNIIDDIKYRDFDERLIFPLNKTIDYIQNSLLKYEQKILFIIDDAICDIKQGTIK